MFLADYHVHSNFSSDCQVPMEMMVQQAIRMGLKELVFTDHVDYDYPDTQFPFMIDYDAYLRTFYPLKEKYRDQIDLILGVEVGLQPHLQTKIQSFLTQYPFDFVIGSTHVVDRLDLYNGDFFKGKEQKNAYLRYFEDVMNSVSLFREFHVYGHLDYIIRYGDYIEKTLSYIDFKDIIDEILKLLIANQQGIEINTSGYRYKLNQTHPQFSILKRYKELGGEILTIGSDAHSPEYIAAYFGIAYDLLKQAGYKAITRYKNRQPTWIDI